MPRRPLIPFSATAWVTTEKLTQQLLWLLLFAVLAPLLGPRAYGLFALAMVVVGFCELVLAEAVAEALLTLDHLTPLHVGTANLCTLVAGGLAGALVAAIAAPVSALFHEPSLRLIFWALAPLPLLSAIGSSPTAILKRQMDFRTFAVRSTVGLAVGGALGVVAGLMGVGVWALVIQVLAQRACEVAVLWSAAKGASRLSWSRSCFLDLQACAVNVFMAKGLTWAAGQVPRVIVGWFLGPTVLGLFTLANRITDLLLQVVVVPPTLVARLELRRFADDREGLEQALKALIRGVGFIAFPVSVGLAAIAPALFSLWLGQRWNGASAATQLMVLCVSPWTYFYCATAVMMGIRRSGLDVVIQAVLGLSAALVTVLAAPFGLNAVCAALLVRLILLVSMPLAMLGRGAGLKPLSVLLAPWGPGAAAAFMGLGVTLLEPWLVHAAGKIASLPLLVLAGAALYALASLIAAPKEARSLLSTLARLRRREANAPQAAP